MPTSRTVVEPGLEHLPRVGHRLQHDLGSSFAQHVEGLATDLTVGNMRVAIDQTGQTVIAERSMTLAPGGMAKPFPTSAIL